MRIGALACTSESAAIASSAFKGACEAKGESCTGSQTSDSEDEAILLQLRNLDVGFGAVLLATFRVLPREFVF